MQNLFYVMECLERFKVQLATLQFEKEAGDWWEIVKPHKGEQTLTRGEFKNLMDTKYYPKDVEWLRNKDFFCLNRGRP